MIDVKKTITLYSIEKYLHSFRKNGVRMVRKTKAKEKEKNNKTCERLIHQATMVIHVMDVWLYLFYESLYKRNDIRLRY